MHKLRFAFSLLVILFITGYGQQTISAQNSGFVKTFLFEERSTVFYAIRNYEEDVIVTGPIGVDTFGNSGVILARIDTFGNVKNLLLFYDPNQEFNLYLFNILYEGMTITKGGDIVVAGSTNRVHDLFQIIVKGDFINASFYSYESQFPSVRYANNNVEFDTAIYTVGHVRDFNNSFEMFIHKSSLDGREIWEKKYGSPFDFDFATSILPNDENLIILGGSRSDNNSDPNTSPTFTKLLVIDTSGQVLSSWQSEINEEGVSAEGLLKIGEKFYYITHPFEIDDIGNVHYKPQLVCRDQNFNLVWRRDYGEPYFMNHFNDIAEGPDGYLYAAGYIPVDFFTWGRVCKIDPEDGELIWEARDTAFVVPGWGSRNRMEGLTVLPSGSVIAAGYTVDNMFREHGLLYKVTADGCIDTLCTTVSIEDLLRNPDERVVVFPNPASEVIRFDLPESEEECLVTLYSLEGVLLHQQVVTHRDNAIYLDRSKYTRGLYIWHVTTRTGQVLDSGKVVILNE